MAFKQQRLPGTPSFTIKGGKVTIGKRQAGFIKCLTAQHNNALAFVTPRKRKAHFFRMYQGYGLNRDLVEYLREHKVECVVIIEDKTVYLLSKVDDWFFHSFEYNHANYEAQLILPEALMKKAKGCVNA